MERRADIRPSAAQRPLHLSIASRALWLRVQVYLYLGRVRAYGPREEVKEVAADLRRVTDGRGGWLYRKGRKGVR